MQISARDDADHHPANAEGGACAEPAQRLRLRLHRRAAGPVRLSARTAAARRGYPRRPASTARTRRAHAPESSGASRGPPASARATTVCCVPESRTQEAGSRMRAVPGRPWAGGRRQWVWSGSKNRAGAPPGAHTGRGRPTKRSASCAVGVCGPVALAPPADNINGSAAVIGKCGGEGAGGGGSGGGPRAGRHTGRVLEQRASARALLICVQRGLHVYLGGGVLISVDTSLYTPMPPRMPTPIHTWPRVVSKTWAHGAARGSDGDERPRRCRAQQSLSKSELFTINLNATTQDGIQVVRGIATTDSAKLTWSRKVCGTGQNPMSGRLCAAEEVWCGLGGNDLETEQKGEKLFETKVIAR